MSENGIFRIWPVHASTQKMSMRYGMRRERPLIVAGAGSQSGMVTARELSLA